MSVTPKVTFRVSDQSSTEYFPRFVGLTGNQIEDTMRILLIPERTVPAGYESFEAKPAASKGGAPGFKGQASMARSAFDALGVQKERLQPERQKKTKVQDKNVLDRLYEDAIARQTKEPPQISSIDVPAIVSTINRNKQRQTLPHAKSRDPPAIKKTVDHGNADTQIPIELKAELNEQMEIIVHLNGEIAQNQQILDRAAKARMQLEQRLEGMLKAEALMSQPSRRQQREKEEVQAKLAVEQDLLRQELKRLSESVVKLEKEKQELLQQVDADLDGFVREGASTDELNLWIEVIGEELDRRLHPSSTEKELPAETPAKVGLQE